MFSNGMNPGCNCCSTPPACPQYTVTVTGAGNQAVGGLGVALAGTLNGQPWTTSGTTNGAGVYVYTMPTTAPYPVVSTATVAAPDIGPAKGCTSTLSFGSACAVRFSYCRMTVVGTFSPEANPTLSYTDTAVPVMNLTRTVSGNQVVWDSCCLRAYSTTTPAQNCTNPNRPVEFRAADPTFDAAGRVGRPPRCATVTMACGTMATVDLTQEVYPECYRLGACGPVTCRSVVGPPYVGAQPRRLQVRFTTTSARQYTAPWGSGPFTGGPLFAGDEGVWIDVVDFDSGLRPGQGNYTSIQWASSGGNLSGTNFLNCPCTPTPPIPPGPRAGCREMPWSATRVQITPGTGTNNFSLVYRRVNTAYDPSNPTITGYNDNTGQYTLGQDSQTIASIPVSALCVPLPTTAYQLTDTISQPNATYTVEFRDACNTTIGTPTPTQAAAPMMMAAAPTALVPLDESIRLTRAAKTCPHRTEPGCGCPGVPGACAIGKFNGAPTLADCIACQADGGPPDH